jgi:hypothetical protein
MEQESYKELLSLGDSLLWSLTVSRSGTCTHFTVTCSEYTCFHGMIDSGYFGEDDLRMMCGLIAEHYYDFGADVLVKVIQWIQDCMRARMV